MSYFKRPAEYYRRTQWSYPDSLRITGSVIPTVLPDVMIVTGFTATIQFIQTQKFLPFDLFFPSVIVPALSVVVGLILAFRTNTAYDRFWEGRKLWSSLDVQMRNFSRMIWVGMKETNHQVHAAGSNVSLTAAAPTPGAPAAAPAAAPSNGLHLFGRNSGKVSPNGKNTAPNTLTEFHHADCAATDHVEIKIVHDKALGDRQRHYNEDPWTIRSGNDEGQMSLPLEIAYALSLWVLGEARGGRIESSLIGNLLGSINTMTDIFTNMERIVFTPIPLAYSIHLRQVVYLYTLALPFTFIKELGWHTVPLMALVSFTLFGMEGIGREIENPFGKDANDLHMDDFCRDLKRELQYLVNLQNTVPGSHA
ncbi:hypothetical protein BGZ90_003750 [Linnemannia elongata]|nr:hypothetical protein BGZ90_003750 [Linnemannia elongata]